MDVVQAIPQWLWPALLVANVLTLASANYLVWFVSQDCDRGSQEVKLALAAGRFVIIGCKITFCILALMLILGWFVDRS